VPSFTPQIRLKKGAAFESFNQMNPQMCPIRDSEKNQQIFLSESNGSVLDVLCHKVLEENIQVPVVSMGCDEKVKSNLNTLDSTLANLKKLCENLPVEIKNGKFSPLEDKIIVDNLETLFTKVNLPKKKRIQFNDPIEKEDLEKANVIGHYLAQGISIRLSYEVFHRARLLTSNVKRQTFTVEEDEVIKEFMKGEGLNHPTPWLKLSSKLGKSKPSIYNRYKQIILHQDKKKSGRYSNDENEIVLEMVWKSNVNVLLNRHVDNTVWESLSKVLNRKPVHVRLHFWRVIEPIISKYKAGTLDKNYAELVVKHLVENKLSFRQEVNWSEIAGLSKFDGICSDYLQISYNIARMNCKKQNPNLKEKDLTSREILNYLEGTERRVKSSTKISREESIISCYKNLISQRN